MPAHLVVIYITLAIPHAQSLKDKRQAVKSLKDRLRARLNASVAEIAFQDEWQRAGIAVAMISNDKKKLQQDIAIIQQLVDVARDISVLAVEQEWL